MRAEELAELDRRMDMAGYDVRCSLVKMRLVLEHALGEVPKHFVQEYRERVAVLRALVADLEQVGSEKSDSLATSETKGQLV